MIFYPICPFLCFLLRNVVETSLTNIWKVGPKFLFELIQSTSWQLLMIFLVNLDEVNDRIWRGYIMRLQKFKLRKALAMLINK